MQPLATPLIRTRADTAIGRFASPALLLLALTAAGGAWAQSAPPPARAAEQAAVAQDAQRNAQQQQRIDQGLQSGSLTTREAAHLEHESAAVDKLEHHDLSDGKLSAAEQARLTQRQNQLSRDIAHAKSNAVHGDPNRASAQRLDHDVQRNAEQQQRIADGVRQGQLSNREVGALERGQAHNSHAEAHAARDGQVSAAEQRAIEHGEDRQNHHVHHERHDGHGAGHG